MIGVWCLAVAVWACAAAGAVAQGPARGPGADPIENSAAAVVARMPRSAELIIVFDGAARLRESALWGVLRPTLEETQAVWTPLAATLGWTPEETFDRVLGERVALVMRGLPAEAGLIPGQVDGAGGEAWDAVRWALVSEVSAETEQRLLERLAASPRDLVRGCQLLSVERGTYELAIYRPPAEKGRRRPARSTLIFAETGRSEMLDELIGVLTGGAGASMRGTPAHRALAGLGWSEAAVVYRWPAGWGGGGGDEGAWSDYLAVAVRRGAGGGGGAGGGEHKNGEWTAKVSVRSAAMRGELLRIGPSTDRAFRALSAGAIAAIVETRIPGEPGGGAAGDPAGVILDMLGLPAHVQDGLGHRQAMIVRPVAEGENDARGMGVALAMEVVDIAAVAPGADAYMADLAAGLEGGAGGDVAVPDFGGVAPGAVRSVPLRGVPDWMRRLLGMAEEGGDGGASLAWVFAGTGATKQAGVQQAGAEGAGRGWWLLGLAPDEPSAADGASGLTVRLAEGLGGGLAERAGEEGERRRWLLQGLVLPTRLDRQLDAVAGVGGGAAWRRLLRQIEEVRWGLYVTEEGGVEGTIRLRIGGAGR